MFDVYCAGCGAWILQYQKDGHGQLLRIYLNRISAPQALAKLQSDPKIKEPKDMPNLLCSKCLTVIGSPMRHDDGRLAFRLMKGKYSKQLVKGEQ